MCRAAETVLSSLGLCCARQILLPCSWRHWGGQGNATLTSCQQTACSVKLCLPKVGARSCPEDALELLWLKNFSAERGREPVEHLVAVVVVVAMQCEVRMYKGLLLALLTSFCPRVAFR